MSADSLPHEATLSASQVYFNRVKLAKQDLPLDYRKIMYRHYPGLNTPKMKRLISNVISLQQTNPFITEVLEKIAKRELR